MGKGQEAPTPDLISTVPWARAPEGLLPPLWSFYRFLGDPSRRECCSQVMPLRLPIYNFPQTQAFNSVTPWVVLLGSPCLADGPSWQCPLPGSSVPPLFHGVLMQLSETPPWALWLWGHLTAWCPSLCPAAPTSSLKCGLRTSPLVLPTPENAGWATCGYFEGLKFH